MYALKKGSTSLVSCGSTGVPAAPVYYPTDDEFKDPLEYIYKIRPEAEPYGICRIVPPKGWNPPFALDLDTFTFPTKTQAIHKLQARSAACDSKTFELEYSRFLQDHCGKKSKKRVVFEGEDLDLCKLFNAVKRFGGYDKVVDGKKWGDVARFLRPAGKVSDCAKHVLCQLYREHLYDYEEFYNRMNQGMARSCKKEEREERKSNHGVQCTTASKRQPRSGSGLKVKDCKVHLEEEHDQICEQCKSGLHGEVMLLCDRCDKGWHIYCLSPPLEQIPQGNWYCFSCLNSDTDSFGFVPGKHYSLEAFRRMADRSRKRWFGAGPVSRMQIEKKFWEIVEGSVGEVEVMYGNDLDTSVFGSGFPRVTNQKPQSIDEKLWQEYSTNPWNLNNLSKLKGSMLRAVHHNITGVMVPWLYIGMLFSSFCWHFEDHCFYSMNYLHWGEPKCWYSVPGSEASAFEKVMRSSLPDLFDAQPDLLFQLVTMLNPSVLQENGVPVYSILQEPGNFVITFPRSYHGGFNLGLNCAEAVNFAPADWLPFGAFAADLYKRYHKPAVLSHEELICVVAQYGDVDSRKSSCLKKELLRISDKEKSWREKLWKNGIVKSSCMAPRECPQFVGTEEDQTCIICQQYLYLSAVVCSCRPSSFVCLEHWEHLCECKTVKLRLLYRHSLAELFDLAFSMEQYTSEDKVECKSVRRQSSCPVALTKKVNGGCVIFNQIATEWLLQSSQLLQNPFSSDTFVKALRKAEQFLWAGSEMDSVRDMVKTLIEAQKWAKGIRDCVTKIEFWYKDSSVKKVHLESIDELLGFNPAPCNEPHYHKLKEYAEEARLLVQEIDTALSICPKMSDLESLYSRACSLPIHVKDIQKLEGKISSTKAWLDSVRKFISVKHPIVLEVNALYTLKSEIADLQVHLPEIHMLHSLLSQVESCSVQCRVMLEEPMNLENVGMLLKKWENFSVDVPELQLLRKYHSDAVSWVSHCNDILGRVHVHEDQTYTVNELMHIFEEGLSLKIQVDELPLIEVELKKAKCREKALKARDLKMPLEFIQQLLEEATMLQINGEKVFINLSSVLALAMPWEERAREILSHESPIFDFEDMIRASENIFAILPSLNDVKDALSEANSWLRNSKPYLVSSSNASNSLWKVQDLQMLVFQSKLLKISLEERGMLELVLKNCKLWECEASCLLDDAQCLFELDNTIEGISSGLLCKVEDLIARIQSTIRSGVSLGFDFKEISKLQASCSTLQWCKRALSYCDSSPSLEDVFEVAEGLSHSCGSGALLKLLVDGVEWLRRALRGISGPQNCRRCKLADVQDILNDYQTINMTFAAVYCQLEEAIKKHKLWQEQVQHFFGLSYGERSWSSLLQLKELGDAVAFSCSELNLILSEVEKVENWKKTCINNIGISLQNEDSLIDVLEKIKQSLERSLFIYGKMQDQKEQNLCICCFIDSEDQKLLTCSTCLDCYHLRCIGLIAKDTAIETYKCPYCEILKGESRYPSGGGLLRFGKKHVELKVLIELQSDAEHLCLRIDERDVLNQLVEKSLACKSELREIVNFASATVDEDISIISEKLTKAVKASEVAGVWDQHDNCELELALAKNLWKIQVNRLLDGVRKPTIQQIQKHMNEGLAMEISLEDYYMLKLTNVNCLGLQWAELAKKVAMDSGALSLDKVYELRVEGENLPVDVDEELQMLRARCMLYCICRKPFNRRTMIACDLCNEWYHFDCMKLPYTQQVYICPACNPRTEESPTNHERLTSARFVEPKTPSPRHTNPRKKQKRDVRTINYQMLASGEHDGSNFRYSSGIECLRWQNRKPFRRASKKRLELRSLSPVLCTQHNHNTMNHSR